MHGALCDKVDKRNDDQPEEAKDDEGKQRRNAEERIDFVFNVSRYLYAAELARFLHGSGQSAELELTARQRLRRPPKLGRRMA